VYSDRLDEASVCLRELRANDETNLVAAYLSIWVALRRCDWEGLPEELALLRDRSADYATVLGEPFCALAFPGLASEQHRRVAEGMCRSLLPREPAVVEQRTPDDYQRGKQRLRIAYISGDFRVHAVGLIIPELIERHDRSRVEVFAYMTKPGDGSELAMRLVAAFDRFVEVAGMPAQQLAERIKADQIDVLIDLSGWTLGGSPEALYLRCAPVQVNWLGYGGTMGHPRLADYIIGDPIVTPIEHAAFYSETIAQLPHCYLPSDTVRIVGERPTRSAAGLPEGVFVFCSFNNGYKYNPALFDLWSRLLIEAPDSILWISHPGETAASALRNEMQRRGVASDRLLFAFRVDRHSDHIARLQLADLALDTFPYNSHSTGVDALWAGVPMVTCLGGAFSSRVGASIVSAAGLPDLVTATPEAYLALALELYRTPDKLASMRRRLNEDKLSLPLFNMQAFTASLEDLYFSMWQNFVDGDVKPILSTPLVTVD
jgi:predicted O-linked N-acetylglucosamine transferase (SPINDLY family)